MNELTFNEAEVKQLFIDTLLNAFREEYNQEKDYWYNLFGQRDMQYVESLDDSDYKFPCFNLEFYPITDTQFIHSTQVEQFTNVSFYLQVFNVRVGDTSKEQLGMAINYLVKQTLQKNFKVVISANETIPNLYDKQVYRRIIRGSFGYDNKNKVFYQGA